MKIVFFRGEIFLKIDIECEVSDFVPHGFGLVVSAVIDKSDHTAPSVNALHLVGRLEYGLGYRRQTTAH